MGRCIYVYVKLEFRLSYPNSVFRLGSVMVVSLNSEHEEIASNHDIFNIVSQTLSHVATNNTCTRVVAYLHCRLRKVWI
jgi:hypothetical protein